MENQIKQWMITQLVTTEEQYRERWNKAGNAGIEFELQRTKMLYERFKPHFSKNDIKQRIAASKATNLIGLLDAIQG
jgi:hypothetical protein